MLSCWLLLIRSQQILTTRIFPAVIPKQARQEVAIMRSSRSFTLPTEGTLLTRVAAVFTLDTLHVIALALVTLVEPYARIAAPDSHADTCSRLLFLDLSGDTFARLFLLSKQSLTARVASPGGAL
jgi:hypothetical protein